MTNFFSEKNSLKEGRRCRKSNHWKPKSADRKGKTLYHAGGRGAQLGLLFAGLYGAYLGAGSEHGHEYAAAAGLLGDDGTRGGALRFHGSPGADQPGQAQGHAYRLPLVRQLEECRMHVRASLGEAGSEALPPRPDRKGKKQSGTTDVPPFR